MKYLRGLIDAGIRISWRILLIGLEGPGKYPPLLSIEDVLAFANEQINISTSPPECVIAVIVASSEGAEETRTVLRRLADEEKSDATLELRKWRLVLLKNVMAELPDDALYGLLALTEFWERFDFPLDSPHVIQGRANRISPRDYFTNDNYRYLIQKHQDWINKETEALSSRS